MAEYSAGEARVRLVPDASRFLAETRTKLAAIQDPGFPVKVRPEVEQAKIDAWRKEQEANGVDVDVDPDVHGGEVEAWRKEQEARDVTIKVDADVKRARSQFQALDKHIESFRRSDILRINLGAIGISGLPALASGLAEVAASLQQVAQAALLVPGGIAAAAASVGTLVFGLGGVGDAWKAAGQAALTSGKDQAAQARDATAAATGLRNAVVDEARARKDVGQAIRDQRNDMRDLNVEMRGGLISESRAILEAQKAREDLAIGNYSDIREAQLRKLEADQRLLEVRSRNTETAEKLNDANAKGIQGSDRVVDANENLIRSQQRTADAQNAVADSAGKMSSQQSKAAASMAALSPNAQKFLQTMIGLKDGPIKDLRMLNQDKIFKGLADEATKAFGNLGPTLTKGTGAISDAWNKTFTRLFQVIGKDENKTLLDRILGSTAETQSRLANAIDPLVEGVGTLAAAGSEALPRVADGLKGVADRFADFITNADRDGSLDKWINDGIDALGHLGGAAFNVGKMFTAITRAASGDWLAKIETFTAKWSEFLNSPEGQQKIRDLFDEGKEIFNEWKPILEDMPGLFKGIYDGAHTYIGPLIDILSPITEFLKDHPSLVSTAVAAWATWATVAGTVGTVTTAVNALTIALGGSAVGGAAGAAAGGAGKGKGLLAAIAAIPGLGKLLAAAGIGAGIAGQDVLESGRDVQPLTGDVGGSGITPLPGERGPRVGPNAGNRPNYNITAPPTDQFPVIEAGPPGPPGKLKRVDEYKFGDQLPDGYVWDIPTKSIRRTSDNQLLLPDAMIPAFAGGGGLPGYSSKDDTVALLRRGEHVFTPEDVHAMGGQDAVYDFRKSLHRNKFKVGGGVFKQDQQWWGSVDPGGEAFDPWGFINREYPTVYEPHGAGDPLHNFYGGAIPRFQSGGALTVDERGNPIGPAPVAPSPMGSGPQGTLPNVVSQAVSGAQRPIGMGISLASDLIQQGISNAAQGAGGDTADVIKQIGPAIGGFDKGGPVIDPFGNPVTPGMAPGPSTPAADTGIPATPAPGSNIAGAFGSSLFGGLGIPGLGGLGGQNQGGGGTQLKGLSAVPGLWGLAGIAGSGGDPGPGLMQWGTQTAQWLGNFVANFGTQFGTTLLHGVTSAFGIDTTYLDAAQKVVSQFGDLGSQLGGAGDSQGDIVDPAALAPGYGVDYSQITSGARTGTPGGLPALPAGVTEQGLNDLASGNMTPAAQRAIDFARTHAVGQPYKYGGVGPNYDCSGIASAVYAAAKGLPQGTRYFTTESDFPSLGFQPGFAPGALNVGIRRGGGGPNSHMALTLPNGVNVESGGSVGGTTYGGGAAGAQDFPIQYHLPLPGGKIPTSVPQDVLPRGGVTPPMKLYSPGNTNPALTNPAAPVVGSRDRGGALPTGWSTVYNGLGHPELVLPVDPGNIPGFAAGGAPNPQQIVAQLAQAQPKQPTPVPRPPDARQIAPRPVSPREPAPTPAPGFQPGPSAPPVPPAGVVPPAQPPPTQFPTRGGTTPITPVAPTPGSMEDLNHNLPWINTAIESGASALGTALATAMGAGGGFIPGLGAAAPYAAGLVQQGGKILEDAANVVSSALVGNVPGSGTTTANAYGETLRPAQRELATAGAGGQTRVASYGPFYGHDTASVMQEINLHESLEQQASFANRGLRG